MKAVQWILKVALLPVRIILALFRLFAEFLAEVSAHIFRGIAFLSLLTALLSYGFGIDDADGCLRMLLAGFLFYLLPCMIGIVIVAITFLEECISSLT